MERRCVLNSWPKEEVRAVIRYEWARGVSGTEIHNRFVEVYGPGVMSKQMVRRWCRTFSDGRQQAEEIPRAGRTHTATTDANVGKVDDMIRANWHITIDEVVEELGISHERAQNIIHYILRYRKVSARWVPRQLTWTHQEQQMAVSLEHLVRYHENGNDFLFRTVTGDETWFHCFKPESKAASMEWKHPSSPVRKKFKTTPLQVKCSSWFSGTPKEFCCWAFGGCDPDDLRGRNIVFIGNSYLESQEFHLYDIESINDCSLFGNGNNQLANHISHIFDFKEKITSHLENFTWSIQTIQEDQHSMGDAALM
ncbi:histone-lysine N-methyltransferase SETMAR [Trichonephila inaurata madagascariensis]|uniref:Histone-lysine N-methyltransferase SETMAR n=1 Tax=Trichonephila inaurata madagascariensis TaxID=2747483 RepID=A0A8X6ITN3_9ARAC|nr:histone-lysine N-methyltransferase SETMAR [Trichonephila inaurata madagascariensis]